MFYYAVKKGRIVGVFFDYETCSKSVDGYPGAEFKRFKDPMEAIAYASSRPVTKTNIESITDNETAIAYVDGSYLHNESKEVVGSGVVYIASEGKHYISKATVDKELATMRQIGGEIIAAMLAVEKAIKDNKKKIIIRYDYEGIQKWADEEWKANNDSTKYYKKYMKEAKDKIEIAFEWIKSHSGDKYNDRADFLAKNAIISELGRR